MSNKGFGGAGIFDYHVMTALQQGWATLYKSNLGNFKELFSGVSDTVLTSWHTKLTEKDLAVRLTGARGATTFPSIVVQLESEDIIEWPIGGAKPIKLGKGDKEQWGFPMIAQQGVLVEVRAPGPEAARALAVVVRAIMIIAHQHFLDTANYVEVQYQGMSAMSPDEEYIAEQAGFAGIGVVRLRFAGKAKIWVPDPTVVHTPMTWVIQADDLTTDDGVQGAVTPTL